MVSFASVVVTAVLSGAVGIDHESFVEVGVDQEYTVGLGDHSTLSFLVEEDVGLVKVFPVRCWMTSGG